MRGRDERGDRGDLERRAERRENPDSSLTTSGADHGDGAELAALPPHIAEQSLTNARLMLPLDAALEALEHLSRAPRCLESWEGWVRLQDGSRAKSLTHSGSFALPREPQRAAEIARAGMRRAQEHWDRNPEYPGARLYFSLSFRSTT